LLPASSSTYADCGFPVLAGRYFLGEVGKGAEMKLVVNMVMGSMMAAFSEGLSLAEAVSLQ
jgi:3-hydroxyisobutyrate dehydrogenase-like beta-hydroxyacid dehydrogenase